MLLPLIQQPLLHGDAGQEVQRGEGLVQQQQIAAGEHGAGEGGALAHAAGELVGALVAAARKAHLVERLIDPFALLLLAQLAADLHGQRQVFAHAAPGKEQILLGHVAAVLLLVGDGLAVHADGSLLRLQEAVGHAEDGALAAAAHAQDAVEGAGLHVEGQLVDDVEVLAGVLVGHVVKGEHTHTRMSQAMSQKPSS